MKSANIVKKLEKEGYTVVYKKWAYWDGVPHVEFDGFSFAIAEHVYLKNNLQGINKDFIYQHVLNALNLAEMNNPVILKKIQEVPSQEWFYRQYLILNMEDYYRYKRKKYPFNEYWTVLQKLEKEID